MAKVVLITVLLIVLLGIVPGGQFHLPVRWNPFAPLSITEPAGIIARFKMAKLQRDPTACLAQLNQARAQGYIRFTVAPAVAGGCPLSMPLRIERIGGISFSSSFLASCPLALSSVRFVIQVVEPSAIRQFSAPVTQIEHVGSYACRNIYHRDQGRISEHATADALDISAFQLARGMRIPVSGTWEQQDRRGRWLREIFQQSCGFFGTALGPDYNAAHAGHFHFGTGGYGFCH
ncbi:extensin [Erwinia sp. OLTSP20]|uniref:extensin-like domain-containing protein n=1 Tax=unclassified Erwinia TaxID=2622719 RepID=UPI000C504F3C|nr:MULTISPECIES: extensin family protein [unclassified Erwinia]PIJ51374.1 extensin [Erwinia sp. OAMSP11]PIJ74158.1 extensin [Erwinia sp. OLSSP12]PIJ81552.1 extensin [Erwinia sp. OLCASP19]PIJ86121.1 extensin [Erwinia sp. OLMTSP26]PIJ87869.1 extensin [Erwinia sp. OLMDSP33]